MDQQNSTLKTIAGPISPEWTIEYLLLWFAEDDDRLSDAALRRPLLALEEALTGTRWTLVPCRGGSGLQEPAVVSLLRSIALLTGRNPALRARTIADVLAGVGSTPPLEVSSLRSRTAVPARTTAA